MPEPTQLNKQNFQSDAQAVAEVVERLSGATVIPVAAGAVGALVVPNGMRLESLKRITDEFLTRPERRRGTVKIETLDAFIDFVNTFKDSAVTSIFASVGGGYAADDESAAAPSLTAVFDYHPQNGVVSEAQFGGWRARYEFPFSPEWVAWRERDTQALSHTAFAAFLEDHIQDVIDVNETTNEALYKIAQLLAGRFATPTELMTLSRGLQLSVVGNVKSARTLSSGEISVIFEESHVGADNKPIQIPSLFAICIPVFHEDAPYNMASRLRYRVDAGRIVWWYTMHRPEKYFDDAFRLAVEKVDQDTGCKLFRGTPEDAK